MKETDPTKLDYRGVFGMDGLQQVFDTVTEHGLIKFLVGGCVSANDWLFHPYHDQMQAVLILVILDSVTGFMKAYSQSNVSSSGFFRSATKIVVYSILLATGSLLDKVSPMGGFFSSLAVISTFLSITEALSIMENISAMGFETPKKLVNILKFARGSDDEPKPCVPKDGVKKVI